jgi:DNA-binding NarL/FixJ family response regulator
VNTVPTRVLIADDSEVVRGLLRRFLEKKWNVEVCAEAEDGQQTVDAAMALSPDLLILDVVMPKLNGIQVASAVKKNLPNTKTIVFTMYGDYVKSVALAAGVSVIVSKPDGICALFDAVEAVIRPSRGGDLDRPGATDRRLQGKPDCAPADVWYGEGS